MGRKASGGGRGRGGGSKGVAGGKAQRLPADMYDDIDTFHRQKEKLSLDVSESDVEGDSEEDDGSDEGVYELSDAGDSEDSDEEADDDSEAEGEDGGMIGRLAKQAKLLGQKLKTTTAPGSDGEEDEEDEVDGAGKVKWGKKKRDYYNADTNEYELTDDEDAIQEEEEEAVRLQREAAEDLQPGDFEEEEDEDDGSSASSSGEEDEGEMTLEQQVAKGGKAPGVERIVADPASLTDGERRAWVTANAPELLALLQELQSHLGELRYRIGPLLEEVRAGGMGVTKEGVSLLEAKNILMLHYCQCIVFYCLLKAEGKPVKDHPVILRLVQLRAYLEKIRPVEKKLEYQIQKLLAVAAAGDKGSVGGGVGLLAEGEEELLQYKPRLGALAKAAAGDGKGHVGGAGEEGEVKEGGMYRAPRLNPVAMEDGPGTRAARRREERAGKESVRRAARSETVRELMAELEGAPEEVRGAGGTSAGLEGREALRARQRREARDEAEEEAFVRVALTKDERKRERALRRTGLSGHGMLDDFADDVADLVGAEDGGGGRTAQRFGADMFGTNKKKGVPTGDAELPAREPLSDRRAKMDSKRARQVAAAEAVEDEAAARREAKRARQSVDATYSEAVKKASSKLAARKGKYAFPETQPPTKDAEVDNSMRAIGRDIEKNRGLTPHRSKEKKNPRKKHRLGYAKAQVRRKGQVQDVRTPAGGYGGEETGIKARVTKSRKL
eukprot:jgi/Tetstr1/420486/TSEL_011599.t1